MSNVRRIKICVKYLYARLRIILKGLEMRKLWIKRFHFLMLFTLMNEIIFNPFLLVSIIFGRITFLNHFFKNN